MKGLFARRFGWLCEVRGFAKEASCAGCVCAIAQVAHAWAGTVLQDGGRSPGSTVMRVSKGGALCLRDQNGEVGHLCSIL